MSRIVALVGRRVLLLDDPRDTTVALDQDRGHSRTRRSSSATTSAITAPRPRRSSSVPAIEFGLDERHVAGQDDDLVDVVGERLERRPQRVAGAARLLLEREIGLVARTPRWIWLVCGEYTTSGFSPVASRAASIT